MIFHFKSVFHSIPMESKRSKLVFVVFVMLNRGPVEFFKLAESMRGEGSGCSSSTQKRRCCPRQSHAWAAR